MAWAAWGEQAGLVRWVGACSQPLKEGEQISLPDGTRLKVVRQVPPKQLRLRLDRDEWPRARTVQLRLLPSVHGVTVALHAEGLPDAGAREETLARWTRALESWDAFSGRAVAVNRDGPPKRDAAGKKGARKPPALEAGLAEQGAAALKRQGPARGTTKSAATKQPRVTEKTVNGKQARTVKKAVPAKKAAPAKKARVARKAAPAKKAAPARSRKPAGRTK
nr:SRPBCC domain-containing protein [Corallococcus exercitus]